MRGPQLLFIPQTGQPCLNLDEFQALVNTTDSFITPAQFASYCATRPPGFVQYCTITGEDPNVVTVQGLQQLYRDPACPELCGRLAVHFSSLIMEAAAVAWGHCETDFFGASSTVESYGVDPWWGRDGSEREDLKRAFLMAVPEVLLLERLTQSSP